MGPPRIFHSGRRTLPNAAAFWILASLFLMLFFASAAASPLYPVYQVQFRFSAATLTAVFAVYVLVLLVTLLFFGSVSDYLGRLPVIITALVFSAAGCALFLAAHDVRALYAARCLQGIATGLASGPIGAALIDLQPPGGQRAPVVTSAFSTLGLALGALITSALVQYAPAPTRLIWWALLAVFAGGILAVLAIAEPGTRRPGVLASLRPAVAVPRQARGTFAGAIPCLVATWALGGLYLSLGPSLAEAATGSPNLRPGAHRWRSDYEVRAAFHCSGLLRLARRLGRARSWHPAAASQRPAHPARRGTACLDATWPVYRSAVPAGHGSSAAPTLRCEQRVARHYPMPQVTSGETVPTAARSLASSGTRCGALYPPSPRGDGPRTP
jgi:MFS family permease